MSWKDILVIVSEAEADEPALKLAEALAQQCADCHLAAAFLTPLPDEPLAYEPTVVAGVWAELRGALRSKGSGIADNDLLIAATAIRFGLTLVSRDARHFARVPGLTLLLPPE